MYKPKHLTWLGWGFTMNLPETSLFSLPLF